MSTQLHEIEALRGVMQITQFAGQVGPMLQLTQGVAGSIIGQPGDLGAIQITLAETAQLVPILVGWMQGECQRRAEKLRKEVEKDAQLVATIFAEAAACEKFIAEFEVPKFAVQLLAKVSMGTPTQTEPQ